MVGSVSPTAVWWRTSPRLLKRGWWSAQLKIILYIYWNCVFFFFVWTRHIYWTCNGKVVSVFIFHLRSRFWDLVSIDVGVQSTAVPVKIKQNWTLRHQKERTLIGRKTVANYERIITLSYIMFIWKWFWYGIYLVQRQYFSFVKSGQIKWYGNTKTAGYSSSDHIRIGGTSILFPYGQLTVVQFAKLSLYRQVTVTKLSMSLIGK